MNRSLMESRLIAVLRERGAPQPAAMLAYVAAECKPRGWRFWRRRTDTQRADAYSEVIFALAEGGVFALYYEYLNQDASSGAQAICYVTWAAPSARIRRKRGSRATPRP